MRKNNKIFLLHILNSIEKIEDFIKDTSKENFIKSEIKQDAAMRRISIIGEATKNLSPSFRKKYSSIDWKKIAGMRNILIHEYFGVNLERVWRTIKKDVPELKKNILKILKNLS